MASSHQAHPLANCASHAESYGTGKVIILEASGKKIAEGHGASLKRREEEDYSEEDEQERINTIPMMGGALEQDFYGDCDQHEYDRKIRELFNET